MKHIKLTISAFVALLILAGCTPLPTTQFEYWDHVILAGEFTPHGTLSCLIYQYGDERFNDTDLFDMRMVTDDGVSDFDSVFDLTLNVFLYQPVYSDGLVTWLGHDVADTVLAGKTLRFYRIRN